MTINFEEDKQEVLTGMDDANALSSQVLKLKNLEDQIKDAEDNIKKLKAEALHISGDVIPNMMSEMNIKTMKLEDGSAIEVKPVYGASITEAKKQEAFQWLRDNDLGDIIKNEVTVSFGRNEDNKASNYANLAKEHGFEPVQKLKVEPMTLKALVRERIESGADMPTELFNVFAGNRTKITRK
tara:strand:- start:1792 stop:2340 length:549 start_codon:yes stop_codon:yes gene_type:complete